MIKVWSFFLCMLFSHVAFAHPSITVFAAASLSDALEEVNQVYQKRAPEHTVRFSFASSSTLAQQIRYGAPADIFISADQDSMAQVTAHHTTIIGPETLFKNQLVLIAPAHSSVLAQTLTIGKQLKTLLPNGSRLAIGDPAHVPAGKYAKESLSYLGVYKQLKNQFAYANNVRAALRLVELGEAELGIVYATDAQISDKVKIIARLPEKSSKSIEYPAVLLRSSARSFYDFLKTSEAKNTFKKYGFIVL